MLNMSDEVQVADVAGKKVQWDPEQMRKIQEHPCFSEKACHAFGRCHIPVAPKCNIQCNYCIRDFDCVNESRPGVTTKVLNPEESVEMVRKVMAKYNYIKVIGIAGPGEPLANEETLETLRKEGCRTVLLTNAGQWYASIVLATFGIGPLFDEVSLFRRGEPSKAERLAGVIARAGGAPAIMVGDRRFDFEAAREAGCPSVGVSYGYGGDELAMADVVIDDLWELVKMRRAAKGR